MQLRYAKCSSDFSKMSNLRNYSSEYPVGENMVFGSLKKFFI